MFVVVEEDPIFTPGTLVRDQFERVASPRVEPVGDLKSSCRNVGLRCSCQGGPTDASNDSFAHSKSNFSGSAASQTWKGLRATLMEFRDRYNQQWIVERLGYRTPVQSRRDFNVELQAAA